VRQLSHLPGGPGGPGGSQGPSAARRRGTDVPLPVQQQGAAAAVPRRDTSPHRYLRHNRYFFDG
jgi:hypothetical protein